MRKPLIAGNWKMHYTIGQGVALAQELLSRVADAPADVCICVPFVALESVGKVLAPSDIGLGAQNMHQADEGAHTGEISPLMLADLGVDYVILGHSERRADHGETDQAVGQKIKAAVARGITPIVCYGEALDIREKGKEKDYVQAQLETSLKEVSPEEASQLVIAYEPIWAIGTGKTATKEQAEAMCAAIRNMLESRYDQKTAEKVRILYGGSVKEDNIDGLMASKNIDGALVGGASLKARAFSRLVHYEKETR